MSPRWLLTAVLLCCLPGIARAAIVEGRVIHPTRPDAVAGIEVQIIGIADGSDPILRDVKADARGRFRFDDLPAPAAYLVRALFEGVVFPGGSAVFREGDPPSQPPLTFHVYDASSDGSALSLESVQWVLERDAGAYRVDLSATVSNDGMQVVSVDADAPPLLRVALPAGHGDIETPFGRLPEGVTVADGVAEIRGPVLPGEQGMQLAMAFDLPESAGGLDTEMSFPDAVTNLRLYVRDFGISVDTDGLHPARPVRQDDNFYLSFVGFDLPSGTRHRLLVRPLPARAELPPSLLALIVAVFTGGLLYLVGRPLVGSSRAASPEPADTDMRHGDALAAALTDLEHDFETGKLSVEDRDRLREDLRRDAVHALARERGLESAEAREAKPQRCECGREAAPGDRFCAACGRPV